MTKEQMMKDDKIANPTKHYQHPEEAKKDASLSDEDKVILFENWLDDIKLKLVAEEENMPSTVDGSKNFIKEINEILFLYREKTSN